MTFDPTKPVQTRGGGAAKILLTETECTYCGEPQPIVALFVNSMGEWRATSFCANGSFVPREQSISDLVNIPEQEPLTPDEMSQMVGRVVVEKSTGSFAIVIGYNARTLTVRLGDAPRPSKELFDDFTHPDGSPICKGSLDGDA